MSKKILIVDDENLLVEILDDFAKSLGYETATASEGSKALEILKTQEINLVLSDINMPGISGIQMLTKARRQNIAAPFVFITGNSNPEIIIDAVRLGATDFLLKPFEFELLEKVIKRSLAIGERMDNIEELLKSIGRDVAPQTHAAINDLRRQINLLRTME